MSLRVILPLVILLPIAVIRANFLLYLLAIDVLMIAAFWVSGLLHWGIVVLGNETKMIAPVVWSKAQRKSPGFFHARAWPLRP